MKTAKEIVEYLIAHPEELKKKKPFKRGVSDWRESDVISEDVDFNVSQSATLPKMKYRTISQEEYLRELDP